MGIINIREDEGEEESIFVRVTLQDLHGQNLYACGVGVFRRKELSIWEFKGQKDLVLKFLYNRYIGDL